jgi:hypothetical protein
MPTEKPKTREKTVTEWYESCSICSQEITGRSEKDLQKNMANHKFFVHKSK